MGYFFGVTGACGGLAAGTGAGVDCFAGTLRSRTVAPAPAFLVAMIESPSDVHMKTIAEIVVAFDNNVADPRGPNAVCEPMPPNAPAKSAAFPLCSKITMIRNMHTITWINTTKIYIAEILV